MALDIRDQDQDIWVWDLERPNLMRLTFEPGSDSIPVWTPDGKRIIFQGTPGAIYSQAADGTGQPERLLESSVQQLPQAVTPDSARLLFRLRDPKTALDIYTVPLAGDRRAAALIQTRFDEHNADISPDGRWITYESNDSGPNEIYVRPFPNVDSGRWQVSTGGGTRPMWSKDGRELFYLSVGDVASRMMVAAVSTAGAFAAAPPRELFEGQYFAPSSISVRTYDVSRDGKRFLMIKDLAPESTASNDTLLVVVLNFFDELRRLAPVKR